MKFNIGDEIKKLNTNGNVYKVINTIDKCYQIKVVDYYAPEDLGDGIVLCGGEQTVWIAAFFDYNFTLN